MLQIFHINCMTKNITKNLSLQISCNKSQPAIIREHVRRLEVSRTTARLVLCMEIAWKSLHGVLEALWPLTENGSPDLQNYKDQAHSCPRDFASHGIMETQFRDSLKPFKHHNTMVVRGWSKALNFAPLCRAAWVFFPVQRNDFFSPDIQLMPLPLQYNGVLLRCALQNGQRRLSFISPKMALL